MAARAYVCLVQSLCYALSHCTAKRLTQCSACLLTAVPPALQAIQRLGLLGGHVPQFFHVSDILRPLEPPPNAPAFVRQPAQPVTPPLQQASAPALPPRLREPPERFMCPISHDVRALRTSNAQWLPRRGLQPTLVC